MLLSTVPGIPTEIPTKADEGLRAAFTPFRAPPGTYRVLVTEKGIEEVALRMKAANPSGPEGAWAIQRVEALTVIDSAARVDRARVARLFGGRPLRVARGPITEKGRVIESITLMSPYPDASLSRLIPGTMIVVFEIPYR